jgi:hypothetical protein
VVGDAELASDPAESLFSLFCDEADCFFAQLRESCLSWRNDLMFSWHRHCEYSRTEFLNAVVLMGQIITYQDSNESVVSPMDYGVLDSTESHVEISRSSSPCAALMTPGSRANLRVVVDGEGYLMPRCTSRYLWRMSQEQR